jgi:hypothetical protein
MARSLFASVQIESYSVEAETSAIDINTGRHQGSHFLVKNQASLTMFGFTLGPS